MASRWTTPGANSSIPLAQGIRAMANDGLLSLIPVPRRSPRIPAPGRAGEDPVTARPHADELRGSHGGADGDAFHRRAPPFGLSCRARSATGFPGGVRARRCATGARSGTLRVSRRGIPAPTAMIDPGGDRGAGPEGGRPAAASAPAGWACPDGCRERAPDAPFRRIAGDRLPDDGASAPALVAALVPAGADRSCQSCLQDRLRHRARRAG